MALTTQAKFKWGSKSGARKSLHFPLPPSSPMPPRLGTYMSEAEYTKDLEKINETLDANALTDLECVCGIIVCTGLCPVAHNFINSAETSLDKLSLSQISHDFRAFVEKLYQCRSQVRACSLSAFFGRCGKPAKQRKTSRWPSRRRR